MKKHLYSRKVLSILLSITVILGCISTAFFGVSAATVDYTISDDFTVGGTATVFGKATDRSNVWKVSDYSNVLLGTATEPTEVVSAYETQQKTVGTSVADILTFTAQPYSIFSFKDYKTTDVVKTFSVDFGAFNSISRNDGIGVCFFYDPITGQAFYFAPHVANNQGLQFALYYSKTGTDATVYRVSQNNNGYNPGDVSTLPANCVNGVWPRLTATYTYETSGSLKNIALDLDYYADNSYSGTPLHQQKWNINFSATDTGNSGLGKFFTNTGLTAVTDFNVGIILPDNNPAYMGVDRVSITYERELGTEYFTELANEFVAAHKTNLLLDATSINSTNAASVLETVNAYNLLADEVKAVLANIDVEGTMMDVGEKTVVLNNAAAPFVPTEKQVAFETYYNENAIGDKTAIDDAAVIEQAIKLYNAIEETHKGNVADKYAKIVALVKNTYVVSTATTEKTTIPSIEYINVKDLILSNMASDAYVTEITGKIDAYDIFNNSGKNLYLGLFNNGDSYLGLQILRGSDSAGGSAATAEGMKISRWLSSATVADNATKFEQDSYLYRVNSISSNLGLNANTSATDKEKHRTLFGFGGTIGIIDETNRYLNFAYRLNILRVTQHSSGNYYIAEADINMAVYYDANSNNTLDEGEIALLDIGYQNNSRGNFYIKLAAEDASVISSFAVTADMDTLAKDIVINRTLNVDVELTPSEEFEAEYDEVFSVTTPDADATFEMLSTFEELEDGVKDELDEKVEEAITKAGLRPETNGSTIRTNTDQNLAFYTQKPDAIADDYYVKEIGSVFCGLGYAIENGLELIKGEDGTVSGGKTYAQGETVDEELMFYLSGTSVSAKENWSTYIVSRSYVIWTDGTNEITIYSANESANNPAQFAAEFAGKGVVIRCVNDVIKTIAAAVMNNGNPDLYEANKGVETDYGSEYAGISYADLTLDENGLATVGGFRDAEATLKMLIAFSNLVSAVAN